MSLVLQYYTNIVKVLFTEEEMTNNIIIVGPPVSGKSTIAQSILNTNSHNYFSVRKYFEPLRQINSSEYPVHGNLLNDKLVWKAFAKINSQSKGKKNFIVDGFPGNIRQAQLLSNYIHEYSLSGSILYVNLDKRSSLKLLDKRFVCFRCDGGVDNAIPNFKNSIICDKCGSKLSKRVDDHLTGYKKRIDIFNKHIYLVVNKLLGIKSFKFYVINQILYE